MQLPGQHIHIIGRVPGETRSNRHQDLRIWDMDNPCASRNVQELHISGSNKIDGPGLGSDTARWLSQAQLG